jgi:hypothetical protein
VALTAMNCFTVFPMLRVWEHERNLQSFREIRLPPVSKTSWGALHDQPR